MTVMTAEEWLRDNLNNGDWWDDDPIDVWAPRPIFQLIEDHHACDCDRDGEQMTLPTLHRVMTVIWDEVEGLNPRPEYPTSPPQAPARPHTDGSATPQDTPEGYAPNV